MKIAKLICVSLMTRVIVEDNLTEEQELEAIASQVRETCIDKLRNDGIGDHIESIEPDTECPLGTFKEDVYFQPRIADDFYSIVGHPQSECRSFEVWHSKEQLLKDYPNCEPIEYNGGDIEEPFFVDKPDFNE